MKLEAIVVAAGRGERLGWRSKPFIKIEKKPILYYTLRVLTKNPWIKNIILVVKKNDIKRARNLTIREKFNKIKKIIEGGETRRLSVERGLQFIDRDTQLILIHDAVRPFIPQDLINKVILQAERFGAAVIGVPLKPTIKRIQKNLFVEDTLDRRKIWEIQTPQIFKKDVILKAHRKFKDENFTDDSALVERLGLKVKIVKGDYSNIKITTPEDLVFAEAILKNLKLKSKN